MGCFREVVRSPWRARVDSVAVVRVAGVRGRGARGTGWLALVAAALGASCGGPGADGPAVLHGRVWCGGAVSGAHVRVYQLVEGERHGLLAEVVTREDGRFDAPVAGYEHLLVMAEGGRFEERGAAITVPPGRELRSIALDVRGGERRDVVVTPLTDVLVSLTMARAAAGEPFNDDALPRVHGALTAHLDLDPTRTPIAALAGRVGAGDDATQHALLLRGLSDIAARAAADLGVSAQDVSTLALVGALRADASSTEARLDGNVDDAGFAPLHLGAACPADSPGARASCRVTSNTLRSELAGGVLRYLAGDQATGLARADVLGWVSALAANGDIALFAGDPPQAADRVGPRVTWLRPEADAQLAGVVSVEVVATDDVGVAALAIDVATEAADPADPPLAQLSDSDPAPGRFAGSLDTTLVPEGALVLRATAVDLDGNAGDALRPATVNNLDGGTISGVVVKGRIAGASVKVYRYAAGVRGTLLGEGTTAADGSFTNVRLADGHAGPLLLEAGFGGGYVEEASPAAVTLDVGDVLRTIVPAYSEGAAPAGVVVSPLTSFAVTYRERLAGLGQGTTVAGQWATATAVIETHFGVAGIQGLAPLAPEDMATLTAAARHGLVLIGLSELARQASTLGGGDAGSYGVAASSLRVWRTWEQDLADGCWNGRAGAGADAPRLFYGGTQALGDDPSRRALAEAIAGYVRSPRNATPFAGIGDVVPLLDAIATGGGAAALGTCGAGPGVPGTLAPPNGATAFDQVPPTIAVAPAEGTVVRGTVVISGLATDNLDVRPTLRFTSPAALVGQDLDGDLGDADAAAALDTLAVVGAEGPVAITLAAEDDAGQVGTTTRHLIVDNVPPTLSLTVPALPHPDALLDVGGVLWTRSAAPTLAGAVSDVRLRDVRALIGGVPIATATVVGVGWTLTLPAGAIPTTADVVIELVARDQVGNQTTVTRRFRHDPSPPALATIDTVVRDEASENVTFATAPDAALGGVPSYNPTHPHLGAAVLLGSDLACDASAPTIAKFGYLLDEQQPPYVQENGGPAAGGRNPLRWQLALTDDGVGLDLATVAYRVVDAVSGAVALDWQPAPAGTPVLDGNNVAIGRAYTIPLYRTGTAAPSIPALAAGGRFRLELRGRDRFGREAGAARCWNLRVMPAPVYVGDVRQAQHGPTGAGSAGKYGLGALTLAGTTAPLSPVAAQVLDDSAPGVGLVELPVFNPTTEPVWVAFDLARPQSVQVTKTVITNYWADYSVALADIDCGPFPMQCSGPSYPDAPVRQAPVVTATSPAYRVRVFEEVSPGLTTELVPCAACAATSVPAVIGDATRVVVQLPARAAGNVAPRKFWVMASLATIPELQPDGIGPYFEHAVTRAGVALALTGTFDASGSGCSQQALVGGRYRCSQLTRFRKYRFLAKAEVRVGLPVSVRVWPSIDGRALDAPMYLGNGARTGAFQPWATAEPAPLPGVPGWPN